MKLGSIFLGVVVLALAGCGSPPPAPTKAATAEMKSRTELAQKLKTLPANERAQYLREHMSDMQNAFHSMAPGGPSGGKSQ